MNCGIWPTPRPTMMSRFLCLLALGLGLAAGQGGDEVGTNEQPLELGKMKNAIVNEDSFQYYAITVPLKSQAVKVKLIPNYGDPDAYLSFTTSEPDDLTATWVMDDVGAEEQVIKRDAIEFCQFEPCILHITVCGHGEAGYIIGVFDATSTNSPTASPSHRLRSYGASSGRGLVHNGVAPSCAFSLASAALFCVLGATIMAAGYFWGHRQAQRRHGMQLVSQSDAVELGQSQVAWA